MNKQNPLPFSFPDDDAHLGLSYQAANRSMYMVHELKAAAVVTIVMSDDGQVFTVVSVAGRAMPGGAPEFLVMPMLDKARQDVVLGINRKEMNGDAPCHKA